MRLVISLGVTFGVLTAAATCARGQTAEWQTAAKDVVKYTGDLLEKKVQGDEEAEAALKKKREELSSDEKLRQLAKELKEKLGTDKPEPDKIKELKESIKEKLERLREKKVKEELKGSKSAELPWPFGKG